MGEFNVTTVTLKEDAAFVSKYLEVASAGDTKHDRLKICRMCNGQLDEQHCEYAKKTSLQS